MSGDPRSAALFASLFTAATAAAFFLTGVVALPVPLYLPLARRWVWSASAAEQLGPLGSLTMDYFGRSLVALGVGVLGMLLGMLWLRVRRNVRPSADPVRPVLPSASPRLLQLALAYAVTAVLLCAALFAYKLYGREPSSPLLLEPSASAPVGAAPTSVDE